jgi:hypothetical protein
MLALAQQQQQTADLAQQQLLFNTLLASQSAGDPTMQLQMQQQAAAYNNALLGQLGNDYAQQLSQAGMCARARTLTHTSHRTGALLNQHRYTSQIRDATYPYPRAGAS